jgi:MoxR-like ATPase
LTNVLRVVGITETQTPTQTQKPGKLLDFMTSDVALVIYLFVILTVIAVLVVAIAISESKKKNEEITILGDAIGSQAGASGKSDEMGDGKERFCMLSKIEEQKNSYGHVKYNKNISLEKICEDFRNYAASRLKLYYDIDDIRRFIAGMAVSKILILQGMSGTGKTSMAHAFGSFMDNTSTVIPVQPMWKERTDLLGYYNEFTKRFNETVLLEKMYEANYSKDIYITVLDEMNIARVEYYFAEFLSLLELPNPDERYIEVVSDEWESDPSQLKDGRIKLPENMWFIGTANNDDSTFAISDKVYDRAMIMNLDKKSDRFAAPMTDKMYISAEQFADLVDEAKSEYEVSLRNRSRLEQLDAFLIDRFHITFGNRIMKQILTYIPVYISCGGDELTALDDIISKKVIRKLETQNPIYLRNTSEELIVFLDELFGAENMTLCKEYIRRLQRNA